MPRSHVASRHFERSVRASLSVMAGSHWTGHRPLRWSWFPPPSLPPIPRSWKPDVAACSSGRGPRHSMRSWRAPGPSLSPARTARQRRPPWSRSRSRPAGPTRPSRLVASCSPRARTPIGAAVPSSSSRRMNPMDPSWRSLPTSLLSRMLKQTTWTTGRILLRLKRPSCASACRPETLMAQPCCVPMIRDHVAWPMRCAKLA